MSRHMYGWRGVTHGHRAHQAARGLEGRSHGSCGIHVGWKVEWRLIWMGTVRGMDAGASWIGFGQRASFDACWISSEAEPVASPGWSSTRPVKSLNLQACPAALLR